ncbi:MAG: RDD family protein [Bacteroidetes bacterium]|nr:RDD family protein [Bacteroidota bacterium]
MLVKLDTGFNIEVEFPISPFAKRLLACIIDWAVMFAYLWLGSKMLVLFSPRWGQIAWVEVLFGLPVLLYHPILEITMNGQSFGKKAMSIKVIAEDGGQPTISQYLIRWIFRIADFPIWVFGMIAAGALPWWCSIFFFSGIASVIASPKSQRIGDLLAGTIIIDTKTTTSWEDTVFTEIESTYQPRYPEVMRLSDKDINTLKTIIGTVKKKHDFDLSLRIADRIKSKLSISTDQNSLDFLETLLKDYNYYSTK